MNEWSAGDRGSFLHNIQQMQQTDSHALRGSRLRYPKNQAAEDLSSRPHGHR